MLFTCLCIYTDAFTHVYRYCCRSAGITAAAFITTIGVLNGYTFVLIEHVSAYTGASSFWEACSNTMRESTSWIPLMSCPLKLFVTQLTFSRSLADTLGKLWEKPRHMTLLGINSLVLFPLCLKTVPMSLAPFSLMGVLCLGLYGVGRDASVLGWLLCLGRTIFLKFQVIIWFQGECECLGGWVSF